MNGISSQREVARDHRQVPDPGVGGRVGPSSTTSQVLGGYGYAEEFDMQRYWRDARLYRVSAPRVTNEMARNYMRGEPGPAPVSF